MVNEVPVVWMPNSTVWMINESRTALLQFPILIAVGLESAVLFCFTVKFLRITLFAVMLMTLMGSLPVPSVSSMVPGPSP